MNCQQYRAELDGIDPARAHLSAAAEEHAGACAGCRAFRRERAALRELIGGLARVEAPPDFELRLRARAAAARDTGAAFNPRRLFASGALAATLAACCALAAAGYVLLRQLPGRGHVHPLTAAAPRTDPARSSPSIETPAETSKARIEPAGMHPSAAIHPMSASRPKRGQRPAASSYGADAQQLARGREARGVAPADEAGTRTLDAKGSGVITRDDPAPSVSATTAIPLHLPAPARPLTVTLKDARGGRRVINIDPVAFGARELVNERGAKFVRASHSQGVW